MFSYQGSCRSFLATALIFYQIRFALSRTFLFFCFAHPLSFRSASSDSLYRLSHLQGVVNSFFHLLFQRFRLLLLRSPAPGCSASASPAGLISCGFSRPRHQRQVLSYHYRNGIVNVFSVFYLFQTIHAIPTIFIFSSGIIHTAMNVLLSLYSQSLTKRIFPSCRCTTKFIRAIPEGPPSKSRALQFCC